MYFIKFLQEIFVEEQSIEQFRLWLQDLLMDTGKRDRQLVLIGAGPSGKSTLSNLVMVLVGLENCFSVPFGFPLLENNSSWFEKSPGSLVGKRLGVGEGEPCETMHPWLKLFLRKDPLICVSRLSELEVFQPENTFIFNLQSAETSEMLKQESLAHRSLIIHTQYSATIEKNCLNTMLGEVETIRQWALTA